MAEKDSELVGTMDSSAPKRKTRQQRGNEWVHEDEESEVGIRENHSCINNISEKEAVHLLAINYDMDILRSMRTAALWMLAIIALLSLALAMARIAGEIKDVGTSSFSRMLADKSILIPSDNIIPNEQDLPIPKEVSSVIMTGGRPYVIDYKCKHNSECMKKDVGDCCGGHMQCVNIDFIPDYTLRCQDPNQETVCGRAPWYEIDACVCKDGQCGGLPKPLRIPTP
ncbi:hypothetical protein ACA910_010620 [Epithemia clementina (nom. ined.)]